VAYAVPVSEWLRGDDVVMAQVRNNPKTEAMKAKLPGAAVQAIVGTMATHKALANKRAGGLFGAAAAGPAGAPT